MGFFLQEIREKCCGALDYRRNIGVLAEKVGIDDERYSRRHCEGSSLPTFKKKLDRCWRKAKFSKSRIAADCSNVIVAVVGVRSPAVGWRHEPFGDQITNLPHVDAG